MKNRILVVDDDRLNVRILEEILGVDYDVSQASSGEDAIRKAGETRPDLVLLDIMMPGMDGYVVCRRLKSDPSLSFTKIILVSAKSMLSERLKGYESGADDYIIKPFEPEELLAKVRVFLRLKSVEEVDKIKDDLLNVFSHETRTPLNAIIGFAEMLEQSPSLTVSDKEAVSHIISCGRSLLDLVDKTIMLTNFKRGDVSISRSPLDLPSLLSGVVDRYADRFIEKNVKLEESFAQGLPFSGDAGLISLAVAYLVDNSLKFTPKGGSVKVRLAAVDGCIELSVIDSGTGIPESKLDTVFNEFHVQDVDHYTRGPGLSLAIVKNIAELHGGTASAFNNTQSPGCTFIIRLPASD